MFDEVSDLPSRVYKGLETDQPGLSFES